MEDDLLKKIIDDPNQTNEVQFPKQIANKILELRSVPFDTTPFPTIIIATQTAGYTAYQFSKDVDKVTAYFHLVGFQVPQILLKPIKPEFPDVVDSADAAKQLEDAVEYVRRGMTVPQFADRTNARVPSLGQVETSSAAQNLTRLRIVCLGVKCSKFFFQALEYLLNHWPSQEKNVQFVTRGDDANYCKLRFCKTACINNVVSKVEFVNINEYLPFGYYHDGRGHKLNPDPEVAAAAAEAAASSRQMLHTPQ